MRTLPNGLRCDLPPAGRRASDGLDYRAALRFCRERSTSWARSGSTCHSSSRSRGTWWMSMDALRLKQRKRLPSAPRPQAIARVRCLLVRRRSDASTAATARPASRSPRDSAARRCPWRRNVAILGGPGCSGASRLLANFRMQNDEYAAAAEQQLHYAGCGDSPSARRAPTGRSFSARVRPTALARIRRVSEGRPPGWPTSDGPRCSRFAATSTSVAIRGGTHRAPARGDGNASSGAGLSRLIAMMKGNREACRHTTRSIDETPPGGSGIMAS